MISIPIHHPPVELKTILFLHPTRLAPNEKTMKNHQREKLALNTPLILYPGLQICGSYDRTKEYVPSGVDVYIN